MLTFLEILDGIIKKKGCCYASRIIRRDWDGRYGMIKGRAFFQSFVKLATEFGLGCLPNKEHATSILNSTKCE